MKARAIHYGVMIGLIIIGIAAILTIGRQRSTTPLPPPGSATAARVGWPVGTVVIQHAQGVTVSILTFGSATARPVTVGAQPRAMAVAPEGLRSAGTVYVADDADGTIWQIGADAIARQFAKVNGAPLALVVAPAGTPSAGSVFAIDGDSPVVTIIDPDGTISTARTADHPSAVSFLPAGVVGAGTALVLAQGRGHRPGASPGRRHPFRCRIDHRDPTAGRPRQTDCGWDECDQPGRRPSRYT